MQALALYLPSTLPFVWSHGAGRLNGFGTDGTDGASNPAPKQAVVLPIVLNEFIADVHELPMNLRSGVMAARSSGRARSAFACSDAYPSNFMCREWPLFAPGTSQ